MAFKRLNDLRDYNREFTNEEKIELEFCFEQIQNYIKENIIDKGASITLYELQLHYNAYTHSYLVIDFNTRDVYLSHRDHGSSKENYYSKIKTESSWIGWKYVMTLIVVSNWNDIKEILIEKFKNETNVINVCKNFKL